MLVQEGSACHLARDNPSSAAVCLLRVLVQRLACRLSAAEQRLLPLARAEAPAPSRRSLTLFPVMMSPLAKPVVRAGLAARALPAA